VRRLHLLLVIAGVVVAAAVADAALIYGTVQVGKAPLGNHELMLVCGADTLLTTTNEHGSFGFKPEEQGKCTLSLRYRRQTVSCDLYSQKKPARQALMLSRDEEGQWTLTRR